MKLGRFVRAASITGGAIFMLAMSASAGTITFNTTATGSAGTGFNNSGNLSLNQSSGVAATLGFVADPNASVGIPSGINFGNFTLGCANCTVLSGGVGAIFGAFTFDNGNHRCDRWRQRDVCGHVRWISIKAPS
jgi:hypothetical protein